MNSQTKLLELTSIFIIVSLSQATSLHSQSTVGTPIVGFQKVDVGVGLNAVGFPLLNNDLLKVSATSLTSNALSLSGQSNVGALLTAGEPYYIEVYSGTLKGDRFDVDTAATKSSSNDSVILSSSSSNNTYPVSSISSLLNGQTIALRKHITLEQIQAMSQTAMTGNNTAANADQIQLYSSSGSTFTTYFLRADGVTWRGSTTGAVSQNKVAVPPGTGVFIKKASASGSLVSTGTVRENDFALPMTSGLQLLAPAFPISYSPSGLGGTAANGWTGNNTSANADQIQIYNNSAGNFTIYFLRADGSTWRGSTTGAVDQKNTLIVSDNAGFFVKRSASDANNVLVNPIAP